MTCLEITAGFWCKRISSLALCLVELTIWLDEGRPLPILDRLPSLRVLHVARFDSLERLSMERLAAAMPTLTSLTADCIALAARPNPFARALALVELRLRSSWTEDVGLVAALTALAPGTALTSLVLDCAVVEDAVALGAAAHLAVRVRLREVSVRTGAPLPDTAVVAFCSLPSLRMLRANLGGAQAAALATLTPAAVAAATGLRVPALEHID